MKIAGVEFGYERPIGLRTPVDERSLLFRADAAKRKMELNTLPGEDLEKLVGSSLDISPSLVKTAEEAWTGKK